MVFDPFSSPSAELYSQRKFSNQLADQSNAVAGLAKSAVSNKYHLEAVRRASEYQKQQQDRAQAAADRQAGQANTTGLITAGIGAVGGIAAALI